MRVAGSVPLHILTEEYWFILWNETPFFIVPGPSWYTLLTMSKQKQLIGYFILFVNVLKVDGHVSWCYTLRVLYFPDLSTVDLSKYLWDINFNFIIRDFCKEVLYNIKTIYYSKVVNYCENDKCLSMYKFRVKFKFQ